MPKKGGGIKDLQQRGREQDRGGKKKNSEREMSEELKPEASKSN